MTKVKKEEGTNNMAKVELKTRGGRKPVMAMLDGDIVMLKRVSNFNSSKAIFLPKEWLLALTAQNGKEPDIFAITYNSTVLTIRPYYDNTDQEG